MELKHKFNFKIFFTIAYILTAICYLIYGFMPATASSYEISAEIIIPSANIVSSVTNIELENHTLPTPDSIVGAYSKNKNKTLLIAHSSTAFKNLDSAKVGDTFYYNDEFYKIISREIIPKSEVVMSEILAPATKETIVLMTCAGEINGADASHRLILTSVKL